MNNILEKIAEKRRALYVQEGRGETINRSTRTGAKVGIVGGIVASSGGEALSRKGFARKVIRRTAKGMAGGAVAGAAIGTVKDKRYRQVGYIGKKPIEKKATDYSKSHAFNLPSGKKARANAAAAAKARVFKRGAIGAAALGATAAGAAALIKKKKSSDIEKAAEHSQEYKANRATRRAMDAARKADGPKSMANYAKRVAISDARVAGVKAGVKKPSILAAVARKALKAA